MNKKAMSPVFATAILLFIAVGLGIIAMNWGRAYLETSSVCAINTKMGIVNINNMPQICFKSGENGYIKFMIENGPNTDIEKLRLRAIGKNRIYTTELANSSIALGDSFMGIVPYNSEVFGSIKQIKIIPEIKVYKNQPPAICSEQGIIIENIQECP